jgi:putative MFS transporter
MNYNSLDTAGLNSLHKKITALSVAGTFLDGYDISIISVALVLLEGIPSFGINNPLGKALIGASTTIGMFVGAIVFGYITDLFGRKTMYMNDMILFIVMTVLSALAWNFWSLFAFRIILGIGLGADYAIGTTIIGEFSPVKYRGKFLVVNVLAWFIGAAVAAFVGFSLLPLGSSAWRYMFIVGVIPAIIVLILRRDVPESARWLSDRGHEKEAMDVEKRLTGNSDNLSGFKGDKENPLKELFSKKYVKSVAFIAIFWFSFDVAFYGIGIFSPTILTILGLKSRLAILGSAIFDTFAVIGGILAIMLIDKLGRKTITIIGFAGMFISLLVLGITTLFVPKSGWLGYSYIIFPMFFLFEVTQAIGPGSTDFVYPIELFPTNDRATAQGFGTSVSRIGAILGVTTFPFIVLDYGISSSLFFFMGFSLLGFLATVFLATETRGKTLEQINQIEEGIKPALSGKK